MAASLGHLARGAATLGLLAGIVLGGSVPASAAPPRERVAPGATLVTLSGGASVAPPHSSRDLVVIARVRELVNALGVYQPATVCPDDLTVPYVLAFFRAPGDAPYARVSFQLGGCPTATVFHGARAVAPPLGGAHLFATFTLIRRLIDRPTPTT